MKINYVQFLRRIKSTFIKSNKQNEMQNDQEESIIHLASVGGTFVDFTNIDLSSWGIQGGLITNDSTQEFIRSISMDVHKEKNWKVITEVAQGVQNGVGKRVNWEYMNLLWPIDLDNPPQRSDYYDAIEAIRVIHPSELYIKNIFGAQYFKGKGVNINFWTSSDPLYLDKYENPDAHFFYYSPEHLAETNTFLKLFKERCNKRTYIQNAIRYYSESFRVNSSEMSFICLCICLETIVPGKEQLTYRFKRNLAVLCSESEERGKKIYKNANLLYGYRSKLVHSGMTNKDFTKFDLFFEYSQILASRMIIEMLLHDVPKIEDLDSRITELGFGQRANISDDYSEFKGNIMSWHKVSAYDFENK